MSFVRYALFFFYDLSLHKYHKKNSATHLVEIDVANGGVVLLKSTFFDF